ncbi:LacI family DNA-binding transcriptional regulator [Salinicoccus sp. YB14-2]|uniref:LacI family DNA-binding transcriptional regulator n=1 Tax=Salinicoccus sp. YB14-2 TaxID=1572701 RepID=UPI00068EB52F|nr:LacI family DNA-binding transcriptional regulator [Salinicoccus sp. YB14-2]
MVTIKDIAKKAGVSPSTVSRVVKDHDGISLVTKQRIRKIMAEMNYTPNVAARNLVTNKSYTIGLVIKSAVHEHELNPFITEVTLGVSESCRERGFSTLSTSKQDDENLVVEVQDLINSCQVDGFILLYSKENDAVTNYLRSIDFPFVVIGKDIMNLNDSIYIDNDNELASYSLTNHLLKKGFKDIRIINDSDVFAVAKDRISGFIRALEENNIDLTNKVIDISEGISTLEDALKDLIENERPDLLLTMDGLFNAKVLSKLYQLDIKVPKDMATATFNDSPLTAFASPPQTTVDIYPRDLGMEAGKKILDLINDPECLKINITIPTKVIERESTRRTTDD